jgi:hypothetical protein
MKKPVLVSVLCLILAGASLLVAAQTGPGALPATWRSQFYTHSWDGSPELFIAANWCTAESMQLFFGPGNNEAAIAIILQLCAAQWPGRQVVQLYVQPQAIGKFYWWPTTLVFVQGFVQHHTEAADMIALADAFKGGILYTSSALGYIAVPTDIDTTKPFQLWYDDKYMTLGPFVK